MLQFIIEKISGKFCEWKYRSVFRRSANNKTVLFCVAGDLMFRFVNDAWNVFDRKHEYDVFVCSSISAVGVKVVVT